MLRTIRNAAFLTSPYPVIVHLKLNCHPARQKKAAALISNVLGKDNLLLLPETMAENELVHLPSPEQLKYKFIIKGMRPGFAPKGAGPSEELDVLNGCEEGQRNSVVHRKALQEESKSSLAAVPNSSKALNVPKQMSQIICLITGMMQDVRKLKHPWEVETMPARRVEELSTQEEDCLRHTARCLASAVPTLRVEGGKVESCEEVDPVRAWRLGVQFAGVFRGMKSDSVAINDALFYQGGSNSGYTLKHRRLIAESRAKAMKSASSMRRKVKIDLISVNQIPVVKDFDEETDFVLRIRLRGAKCDEKSYEFPFQSDGFRYIFEKEDPEEWHMIFDIAYPLEAVFVVSVECGDTICKAAFPAASVRQGYRIVPLCDVQYKPYAFSAILGRFEVVDTGN